MDQQLRSRILPVIDLKGGLVVRGVAGKREAYRPVESLLTAVATPASIAKALRDRFQFSDVYVADLDAIAGGPPAWKDYEAIARAKLKLYVDAGAGDSARVRELADAHRSGLSIDRIILGLETLFDRNELVRIVQETDTSRLVFSLDLKEGKPLATTSSWVAAEPIDIVEDVIGHGIRQLIVLDLAHVGTGQGTGTEELCRRIKQRWPDIELIGGGGVRSSDDVERLCHNGLSRVLIASALHDGGIV